MSRKPRKAARESHASKLPPEIFPPRFRAPREMRVVSSIRTRAGLRVPCIEISGRWLARRGFSAGTPFLLLADDLNQIVLVRLDVD